MAYQPSYADMIPPIYAEAIGDVRALLLYEAHHSKWPDDLVRDGQFKDFCITAYDKILRDILEHYYQEDWWFTLERAHGILKEVKEWKPNVADQ